MTDEAGSPQAPGAVPEIEPHLKVYGAPGPDGHSWLHLAFQSGGYCGVQLFPPEVAIQLPRLLIQTLHEMGLTEAPAEKASGLIVPHLDAAAVVRDLGARRSNGGPRT